MRYRWPNNAQCAVVLSWDVDAESGYVYRFPKERAAEIAVTAIIDALDGKPLPDRVIFCCFDKQTADIYRKLLQS